MSYEMINSTERRQKCAELLKANVSAAAKMSAFIGMDGFIDEIVHVVDKRVNRPNLFASRPSKFGAPLRRRQEHQF